MSTPTNTERVQQMYAAFGRGDIQAILNALSPDVTWAVQGPAWLPFFGNRRGRQQAAQFFQAIAENLDIQEFAPREFIAEGDKVVVIGYERSQAKPTGRPIEGAWVHVFTFRGGQVVEFREFCDTAATAAAFPGPTRAVA